MSFLEKKQQTKTFFIRCRKNRQNPGGRCWGRAVVVVPERCSCLYLWTRDRAQYSTFEHALEVSGQNSDYWPILNTQQDLACHSREPIRICSISLPYSSTFICFFFFFGTRSHWPGTFNEIFTVPGRSASWRKRHCFFLAICPLYMSVPPAGTMV